MQRLLLGLVLLCAALSAAAQITSPFTRARAFSCGNQACSDVHLETAVVPGAGQYSNACRAVWRMIYVFDGDEFSRGDETGCYYIHETDPGNPIRFTAPVSIAVADPKNNGCCETSVGNPISPGPANKYELEIDYAAAGPFPLQFQRTYNTNTLVPNGRLGSHWRSSYDRSLLVATGAGMISTTEPAIAFRHDGRILYFQYNNAGEFEAKSPDVTERLSKITNASGQVIGFRLTTTADETETYSGGALLAITNRAGLSHTMGYNAAGRLSSVTDSFGRSLTFTYGSTNRIVSMTDPAGGVYQYGYDSSNNLTSVTFPGGAQKVYHYNEAAHVAVQLPNALTGITDENSQRFATFKYDHLGRPIRSEHAGGAQLVTVSYSGAEATVTDAKATARRYTFLDVHGLAKGTGHTQPTASGGGQVSTSTNLDSNANPAFRIDFNGNRTNYTYDLVRNLETSRTEGLTFAGGTTPQTRTITTQWHPTLRLATVIAEPLRITTSAYDASGNLLSRTIQPTSDATGAQGMGAPASGASRNWTYTHNANGSVLTIDGPRADAQDVTAYTYYANDDPDPGKRGNVATVINAAGHQTSITAYNAHGQPLTIVDPNGLVTIIAYDQRLRVRTRSVGSETTSYEYDAAGQLTRVTLPDASFLSYAYDAAHRLNAIQDNLGNRVSYTLDATGNRTLEQVRDSAGQLAQTRSRVYNNLNRLARELGATGQTTEYAYDDQGNVISVKDPLARVTSNQYDALNRLRQVADPASGVTQYQYNGLDALTSVSDPRNLVTGYAVDGLGSLNLQSSPDSGTTTSTYDAAGNLLAQTDAKGQVTRYAYDALNRVTLITFHDGSKQVYAYDQGANGIGRLSSITEADPANQVTSAIAYSYDQHGRVGSETRLVGGVQYVLGYVYDSFGRLNGLTYPSGRTVSYGFDALGRVSQVLTTKDDDSQVVVQGVAYHPFGGVRSYTLGNTQSYARGIDLDGRIASYTLGAQSFAIGYDPASRIAFISDIGNPVNSNTYGHDDLDRLTSAVMPGTPYAYTYDSVGNRLSRTAGSSTDTYAYSGTSNRLASITSSSGATRSLAFDANGSATADGVNSHGYDVRGRMVQATSSIGTTSYQINALGQRARKSNSLGDTVFHYDTRGRLIAETTPAGMVRREIIYLGDIPVGIVQ